MPRAILALRTGALALLLLALPAQVVARPQIRTSFFNAYPTAVGTRLDNLPSHSGHCGVCHYDFNGAGPKNPFGNRVQAVLGSYPNTDAGRQAAIHSIELEDSDGDGVTQFVEITDRTTYVNTPTFPGLTAANVGLATNVPVAAEVTPYLVPVTGVDTTPPAVAVTSPNGGESWVGGSAHAVTWTASDPSGVSAVHLDYRDGFGQPWTPIARGLTNSGTWIWFVHDTPTAGAAVRVVAVDGAGNVGVDSSNAVFAITAMPGGLAPTTLRDFHQRGSQPFDAGTAFETSPACLSCHGGYDPAVEPGRNAIGTMMMQSARDPIFKACLAIAEQDAPGSGDLCIRCHSPIGWVSGRSQPTSGASLNAADRDGVSCDYCHRMVDPVYVPGVSPAADAGVLAALLPAHVPTGYSNGQFVLDPDPRKRGPFDDAVTPHAFLGSPFHRTSELCATCHDVSNPVFVRTAGADYAPDAFDAKPDSITSTTHFGLERTYSEWKNSAYPAGVYAPDFAGNLPDGIVRTCQDCHMRDVTGTGCNVPGAPTRVDLPLHDLTGGNSWMPGVIASLWAGEVDAGALAASSARAVAMLQKAAVVDVALQPAADSFTAVVTVTNRTGHKLPTGYPEGRRMWLHVVARDENDAVIWESGAYDAATGVLAQDAHTRVYETHLGISPGLAAVLGLAAGPSFHFALNDTVIKDNRIPPLGFTNAGFATFNGQPVDPEMPGPAPRYADGQNWDMAAYGVPAATRRVVATLRYQSTSKEYVEFLRDANTSTGEGDAMHDAWVANGRAAPVDVDADSAAVVPAGAPVTAVGHAALSLRRNPFGATLEAVVALARPSRVVWRVLDVQGRQLASRDDGWLGAGSHRFAWNGRGDDGRDAGAGVVWVRAEVDGRPLTRQAVRLR